MTNGRELCLFPCRGVCLIYPVGETVGGCSAMWPCFVFTCITPDPDRPPLGAGAGVTSTRKKKKTASSRETAWLTSRLHQQARSLSLLWFRRQKYICASFFKKKELVGRCCLCVWCPVSAQAQCCTGFLCVFFFSFDLIWSILNTRATRRNNLLLILEPQERGDEVFSPTTTHTVAVNLKEEGTCLRLLPTVDHHFPVHFTIRFPPIKHY